MRNETAKPVRFSHFSEIFRKLNHTILWSSREKYRTSCIYIFAFIAAHAIGQGSVIWVFISEIFPNRLRATGQAFGASVHWVFAAIITLITPLFLDENEGIFKENPWPIFVFFALMMVVQLIWVLFKMPETKGVSLEEIENKLIK